VPSRFPVTYACTSVSPAGIDCSKLSFDPLTRTATITPTQATYENALHPPGTYTVTFTGTATDSSQTKTTTATLVLTDVCDPPTALNAPTLTDQTYIVTDVAHPTYTHQAFTATPSYCPFDLSYTLGTISGTSDSALTRSGTTFSFSYNSEISDYSTVTQTTTITASHKSIYNASPVGPTTQSASFTTSFTDPCITSGYVTLTIAATDATKTDSYSGSTISNAISVTTNPSWCPVTVTCDTVTPSSSFPCISPTGSKPSYSHDVTIGDSTYYAGGSSPVAPGTYTISLEVYTGSTPGVSGLSQKTTYSFTLTDPCLLPSS